MHGRKKVSIDEAHKIKLQKKAQMLQQQYNAAMDAIRDPSALDQYLASGTPILDYLDDFATLWNRRKEFVQKDPSETAVQAELDIALRVMASNPKSYWAWHHRRWCIGLLETYDYTKEVAICDRFLGADCRNFHAWRHRRWAVAKCGNLYDSELQKTYDLISAESSNFSAWHYRSQLPNLTDLRAEVEMVVNACWMDVADQSAWIYYRWLLNHEKISQDQELIEAQVAMMDELMELENGCKNPYLAGIWLQRKREHPDEAKIRKLKDKLCEIDPIRAPYYEEQ